MRVKQGNARHCFVCGVENPTGLHIHFYQPAPGEVEANIRIPAQYQSWSGVVHGGIIAAMLDEAAGRAFLTGGELDRFFVTAKLTIRYRRPVPVDTPLRLLGHVKEEKGRVSVGTSEIVDLDGNVLAEAEGIMTSMPEAVLTGQDGQLDDWNVYPDEEINQA